MLIMDEAEAKDSAFLDSSIEISFCGGSPDVPMQVELSDIERSVQEEKCGELSPAQADFRDATMKELESVLRECWQDPVLEDFQAREPAPKQASPETCIITRKVAGSSKPSFKSTQPSTELEHRRRTQDIETGEPFVPVWNCGVCITENQGKESWGCMVF